MACTCNTGFGGDGFTCESICESNLHGCHANASCDYNQSTEQVTCTCNPGFTGSGTICEPICESNLHGCHANASCDYNQSTEQVTCTCNPGFTGSGTICESICESNLHGCHANASCDYNQSTEQVTCTCNLGFTGSGTICEPICESNLHGCHANASCNYNQSTEQVTCTCNPGFTGSGTICEPICESNLHGCHANASCDYNQITEQVTCTCNPGFTGSGTICEPICESNLHGCHANADCQFDEITTQVLCTCNPGFIGGGTTCEPCNVVCTENMHCVIEEAGITYCDCDTGYSLQGDTCVAGMILYSRKSAICQNILLYFAHGLGLLYTKGACQMLCSAEVLILHRILADVHHCLAFYRKLPFLDTLLHYKNNESLDVSIYRKPTHTNWYLHFSSHHPRHVKEGVVSCFFHQARTVIHLRDSLQSATWFTLIICGCVRIWSSSRIIHAGCANPHTRY